jgi:hypothetical protein
VTDDELDPMEQGLKLRAALGPNERVQLVDDDEAEAADQRGDAGALKDEECLKGLRCDEQNPARCLEKRCLPIAPDVTVPAMYRNVELGTKFLEAPVLIIDQRL